MTDLNIPHTHAHLVDAFQRAGIRAGQALILHASVKAVGAVMGGPNVILQALMDALTPDGTLMMYAGWQDIPDFIDSLPDALKAVYLEQHPPFDPATARAVRENSVLAEFLRTWPCVHRSANPEASMVAVGRQAALLTANHALDYGYGVESPLAKLVAIEGYVLMLGAPLDTITLLHHAEYLAKMRHKNVVRYPCPILRDGRKVWVTVEDYDTGDPHDDYSFEQIARDYVAQGGGTRGKVGDADAYLFAAQDLTRFAVQWLESRFGDSAS